jgi:HTH-type transcriptional regulator/antitoxin HigA
MARRSAQTARQGTADKYLGLVKAFPLRPIRSDDELDRAIAVIDSLITRSELDLGEADYLDVLGDLVHKYESVHDPIAPVDDADMVLFLLESNGMPQTELARRSGIAESTISEILARKRKLSRRHITALAGIFRVSPAVFFHEEVELTPERAAEVLSRRCGHEISRDLLVSLASAFAADTDRGCWQALQELVAGEKPGIPTPLMAKRLNTWDGIGGCWWPAPLHLTGVQLQAFAEAFSAESDCWKVFREMVEDSIPEMRAFQRDIAEEN